MVTRTSRASLLVALATSLLLAIALLALATPVFAQVTAPPKTDELVVDLDGDGRADPGDVIRYTVVISNGGSVDLAQVVFTDTLSVYTTLSGTLRTTPLALDDAYDVIGNVGLDVARAGGVLVNDVDPDGTTPALTIVAVDTAGTLGSVVVAGDGGFTYDPPVGYEGADVFAYTIEDADGNRDVATVTLTVGDVIWFIDNSAAPGGDGRLGSPYNTLAAFVAANGAGGLGDPEAGAVIFIHETGSGDYTGGLTLLNGQRVVGQGASASLATAAGLTVPAYSRTLPATGGSSPVLTSSGNGITLAQGNRVHGLVVGGTTAAGMSGTSVGTLTVRDVSINGSGEILSITGGTLDAEFDRLSTTGAGTAVQLQGVGGSLQVADGAGPDTQITGATVGIDVRSSVAGTTMDFAETSVNATTQGVRWLSNAGSTLGAAELRITVTNGTGLEADSGALALGGTTNAVSAVLGPALDLENLMLSGGAVFESIDASLGLHGISLDSVTGGLEVRGDGASDPANTTRGQTTAGAGGVTLVLGSGGTIQSTTGDAIVLTDAPGVVLRNMVIQRGTAPAYADGITAGTVDGLTLDNVLLSGFGANGLLGTGVSDLVLQHCEVTGNAKSLPQSDLNDEANLRLENLSGTSLIGSTIIRDASEQNVWVINTAASTLALTVDNSLIADTAAGTPGNGGLDVVMPTGSTSQIDLVVRNSEFRDNRARAVAYYANAGGHGSVRVTGSTFERSTVEIDIGNNAPGQDVRFEIDGNVLRQTVGASTSNAINLYLGGLSSSTTVLQGTVSGNAIGSAVVASSGSSTGDGIALAPRGAGTMTVNVAGNTVRGIAMQSGLSAVTANHTGGLNLTLSGNDLSVLPGVGALAGVALEVGAVAGDTTQACIDFSAGNNIAFVGEPFWTGVYLFVSGGTPTIGLVGYAGAANDAAAIGAFLDTAAATVAPTAVGWVSISGGTVQGQSGPCTQPASIAALPLPRSAVASASPLLDGARSQVAAPVIGLGELSTARKPGAAMTPKLSVFTVKDRPAERALAGQGHALASLLPASFSRPLASGETLEVSIDTLPVGEAVTVTFDAVVDSPLDQSVNQVANQGRLTAASDLDLVTDDPDTSASSDPTVTLLDGAVDLAIAKSNGVTELRAGDTVTYTIVATNNGPYHATTAGISDSVPALLLSPSWTCVAGLGAACDGLSGSGDVAETAALSVGAQITYTLVGSLATSVQGTLTNTAEITVPAGFVDTAPADNVATDADPVIAQIDLQVAKTESVDPVLAGSGPGNLVYVVTVTNVGSVDATGVAVAEVLTLPSGVTVDAIVPSAGGVWIDAGGTGGTWIVGDLLTSASATLTVQLTVGASAATGVNVISDQAMIAAADQQLINTTDDQATESTSVTGRVDLVVTKTESVDPVVAGSGPSNLTYVITLGNHGPSNANAVEVSELLTLPAGVSVDSVTPSTGIWVSPTWTIPTLPSGDSETLTVVLTVGPSASEGVDVVADTAAIVSANETLINTGDDSATESTSVERQVDLAVTKADSVDPVVAGSGPGNLTHTVTVENYGPSDATDVALSDVFSLPPGVVVDSVTPSGGSWLSPLWTLPVVPAGATEVITVVLTVGPSVAPGIDVIVDVAMVTAVNETEANPANDSATEATSVGAVADLGLAKIDGPDPALAGATLYYTLTVDNAGPSDAAGVVVTDPFPPGYTPVATSCGAPANPLVWSVGPLPLGEQRDCVVTGTLQVGFSGLILNVATVAATTPDPEPVNNAGVALTEIRENTVAISDAARLETDAGTAALAFVVNRMTNFTATSVDVATADGTAVAGDDYTAVPATTVDFPAGGALSQTVIVDVLGDGIVELDETFTVTLSNPAGGVIADDTGLGTILNDDAATVSIDDVSVGETDGVAAFDIALTDPVDVAVSVEVATADGIATVAGGDYDAVAGQVITFAVASTAPQQVTVTINDDVRVEANETYTVSLGSLVTSGRDVAVGPPAVGTIVDDDVSGVTIGDTAVDEDIGAATLTVTQGLENDFAVVVDYLTVDGSAQAGADYVGASGQITIPAGASSGTIGVTIVDDGLVEATETLTVVLANPRNAVLFDGEGAVSILDDDNTPVAASDLYTTAEDTPLTVAVPGVLANDVDPDMDPLSAVLDTAPTMGLMDLASDGSFVYTPSLNHAGVVTFTYVASDGANLAAPAAVTITVLPVNDAPTISDVPDQIMETRDTLTVPFTVDDAETPAVSLVVTATSSDLALVPTSVIGLAGSDVDRTVTVTPTTDVTGTVTITLSVTDGALSASDSFQILVTDRHIRTIYLPLLVRNYRSGPDLVVRSLSGATEGVVIVLENAGTAALADAFWVDLYVNPRAAPTAPNETWQLLAPNGAAWGVTVPLAVGEVLTLTLNDAFYEVDQSDLDMPLSLGDELWAQVDSANVGNADGAVSELDEGNNVGGPVAVTTDGPLSASAVDAEAARSTDAVSLPPR